MASDYRGEKQGLTIIYQIQSTDSMAQRYVRIQTTAGSLCYGLLQLDRRVQVLDAPPWLTGQPTDTELGVEEYTLLAPCAPSKIIAVGKNYLKHAREMGGEVPKEPLLFMKPSTAVIATGDPIAYPPQSSRVDYEGELALIIGDRCSDCTPEQARSKIWGFTIANDVTARDLQKSDGQWTRAKGFDTFCPLGPWIVRELSTAARLQTFLNDSPTPYISQAITLLPGDVVLTGTPDGIGPVQVGDRIRVEIEGIGSLENSVIAKPPAEGV
jgi:2-keto-4-pentenoate hydratase/2-oxohepta-3-ene-1,7-dioic acid hydratase in catechol pathway